MAASAILVLLGAASVHAYLPGVGSNVFIDGQSLTLDVNELDSLRTQIPRDYYSLPFCTLPGRKVFKRESLGQQLEGEIIEATGYTLSISEPLTCRTLCDKEVNEDGIEQFKTAIDEDYQVHMMVDSLPAVYALPYTPDGVQASYSRGFPVGFKGKNDVYYINNHLRFQIALSKLEPGKNNIVGFLVQPFSYAHKKQGGCPNSLVPSADERTYHALSDTTAIRFTYDVVWETSNLPWSHRWDIYFNDMDSTNIHWFSVTNSSLIVVFLAGLVAMILLRALRRDIARYNEAEMEEAKEESGWKLVHGDVFRPPQTLPGLFAVFVGTGVQLSGMSFLVLFFVVAGLISPSQRGNLLTATVLIFVLVGSLAGYQTARIHRVFRGTSWFKVTAMAATLYPAFCFLVFLSINAMLSLVGSTAAVKFAPLCIIILLWLTVQAPLVFFGSYIGFRKEPPNQPVRTNAIPRQVPEQPWFLSPWVALPFSGILPFGAVSVELYFIMTAVWLHQLFFIFGFLLLAMIILMATCAEISIVLCYFQLCAEDHRWWWRSLQWSGSCAGYLFLYSAWYFFAELQLVGIVPALMYFGYSALIAVSFALATGAVGYLSCFWFVRKIYGSIKVD